MFCIHNNAKVNMVREIGLWLRWCEFVGVRRCSPSKFVTQCRITNLSAASQSG